MRHLCARTTVAVVAALALSGCGQIGDPHATPTPGAAATTAPSPVATTPGPLSTVIVADACAVVKQLQRVDASVSRVFESLGETQDPEQADAALQAAIQGFEEAQADLAQVPGARDPNVTKARQLLGSVIAGFIQGLQDLSEGYADGDQDLLVQGALEIDQANTMFEEQYGPTLAKADCP